MLLRAEGSGGTIFLLACSDLIRSMVGLNQETLQMGKSILHKFCGQATPLIQAILTDTARCHIHQVYHSVSALNH